MSSPANCGQRVPNYYIVIASDAAETEHAFMLCRSQYSPINIGRFAALRPAVREFGMALFL
jgi:hypothetical protein